MAHAQGYGYATRAAAPGAWRVYDVADPDPGYFEFDWLSARHPDLYHAFALSSVALVEELARLDDLAGLDVVDVGAGTGRSTLAAAAHAKHVYAVDAFASVLEYGRRKAAEAGATNVTHIRGDRSSLPFGDSSVDAVICVWAELDHREAHRILRPGGLLAHMHCAPGSLCGELTAAVRPDGPDAATDLLDPVLYDPSAPPADSHVETAEWCGAHVEDGIDVHDFTDVATYPSVGEAAAILGRLYGPTASAYLLDRDQRTVASRLRISRARAAK